MVNMFEGEKILILGVCIINRKLVSFAKWNQLDFSREFDDKILKHCELWNGRMALCAEE